MKAVGGAVAGRIRKGDNSKKKEREGHQSYKD
jgi:hypothetical protein